MFTSENPDPHSVLQPSSTTNTPPRVLCSASLPSQEDILLFRIGLRMLGEQKKERFLAFMATLNERKEGTTHGI